MKLQRGNMWSVLSSTDLFLVTTNATLRKDGAVVMGRGIAAEAKARFPSLPYLLGRHVQDHGPRYGLLMMRHLGHHLGAFQVKYNWWERADPALIGYAAALLRAWCTNNPEARVDLPFPGIGNGRLPRGVVLPIVETLPDTVHVWEFQRQTDG